MPNPFKSKPGSKKLNDPVSQCPLNKAEIRVEVYGVDPRGVDPQTPIAGVGISVTGPTATNPAKTPANGQWRYQPLNPGAYTVTPTFTPELSEKYDVTGVAPLGKNPIAGGVETAIFLVPWTWVEFIAKDTVPQTLANLDWILERRPLAGGSFTGYDSGTTPADGKVYRKEVKTGTHRFTVKDLTNPAWSATEAVIGEEIILTATTDGFAVGDAGTFEIVDAYNVKNICEIVNAKVKNSAGTLQLEAKWKPKESAFANLKHSNIAFQAKAGNAVTYSATVPLLKKESVKFANRQGTAVDRQIELYFSSGMQRAVTTAQGKVDLTIPWAENLLAVKFPGLAAARVTIDPGANPGGVAIV